MVSVYTNDLRLEEIGSGEQSGTWGDTTNTNLELIAEGLSFGTEAITTNANTHTSTVADGASDPARSMYIKYTGALDSDCTITIAPNTLSRVHIIENATTDSGSSGPYNILISQGDGDAKVTIPKGHKKVVYLDGAGSGGVVVDAFTDLNVPSLFVKNPGTGDNSTALLTLQTAEADIAANDVLGKISFQAPDEGTGTDANLIAAAIQAISEGDFSSSSNATSLNFMTGASEAAATKMTLTSGGNLTVTGVGTFASLDISGDIDVDGTSNLDIIDVDGAANFAATVTFADGVNIITASAGTANVRLGSNAGTSIESGGNNNVCIGDESGTSLTTGDENTFVGHASGDAVDRGHNNVAIGKNALSAEVFGCRSVAIGHAALFSQTFSSETNALNVAIGFSSGAAIISGQNNTLIGGSAGGAINTGDQNTIVGTNAGDALNTGNKNVAVGRDALTGGTTYDGNTAIGWQALKVADNTSGADGNNVAIGADAASAVTSGIKNVLIGVSCAAALRTGGGNVMIGQGTNVSAAAAENQITIGQAIACDQDSQVTIGKTSNVVKLEFDTDATWTRSSDVRKKKNIENSTLGLDFVNDLRPVTFEWKPNNEFPKDFTEYSEKNNMTTGVTMHGMIAQEVKSALDNAEVDNFGGWKEDNDGSQRIAQDMFIYPLIKAMQELSAQVDTLKAEIKELKNG